MAVKLPSVGVPNVIVLPWPPEAITPVSWLPLPIKKLPETLPVADTRPDVKTLPPVMLPVELTNPPVKILPSVALPVAESNPPVIKLPPVMLPVELTSPPVLTFPLLTLPVKLRLVPVAAPMFGVVKLAPALTMILPEPSNAVVF